MVLWTHILKPNAFYFKFAYYITKCEYNLCKVEMTKQSIVFQQICNIKDYKKDINNGYIKN